MPISDKTAQFIERSSWIRAMFEAGAKLKAEKGAENVFDFSLGNPNLEPPDNYYDVVAELAGDRTPGIHGYMPNAGYPAVRAQVADYVSKVQGVDLTENEIIMTVGAAGALNITLKAIINPGSEVVVPTPYFVEYDFYLDNHGGKVTRVDSRDDFGLDVDAVLGAINENTVAVLINSPNNPTGALYTAEELAQLGKGLTEASERLGRVIYLISDEPYRDIVYDGAEVPSLFAAYQHSIIGTSFSKNLSLPGERIGYAVVHPDIADKAMLLGGMTLANRILGFVNAPALMQRVVGALLGQTSKVELYAAKREAICSVLSDAGYEFVKPMGAFYVFPKSPIEDDVAFVKAAREENLLLVPGSGFIGPGYFRVAFCCDDATIERSAGAFKRVRDRF